LVDFPAFNEVSVLFDTLKTDVQAAVADGSFTLGLQAKASNLAGGSLALISVSVSVVESTLIAIVVPPTAVPTGHPTIEASAVPTENFCYSPNVNDDYFITSPPFASPSDDPILSPVMIRVQFLQRI
jgi:hypothetical protein